MIYKNKSGVINMSKDKINLILIVDESGSMTATADETKGAVAKYVEDQRKLSDVKFKIEIVTFASTVNRLHPLSKLENYEDSFQTKYSPCGMTALYDAIGTSLTAHKNSGKKTIVTIITDGQENASKEYNKAAVSELIKDVQDNLGWEVIFLAANLNNFEDYTKSLNIKAANKMQFADVAGARGAVFNVASNLTATYSITK
jgi:Mg-chelatase subunit ChlD